MRRKDVFRHFGGHQAAIARFLDISPVCIAKWGPVIPESCATRLHLLSKGRVPYDATVYDRLKRRKPVSYRKTMAQIRQRNGNGVS